MTSVNPTHIYSYTDSSSILHSTHLLTGKLTSVRLSSFVFPMFCSWYQLPSGCVMVTGGRVFNVTKNVVSIDVSKDYAVTERSPMSIHRDSHSSVHIFGYLYVVGGITAVCERYSCNTDCWEIVGSLPKAVKDSSIIALEATQCIYSFGGRNADSILAIVQRLRLDCLEWDELPLTLPSFIRFLACFKIDETKVYFLQGGTLYVFQPIVNTITPIRSINRNANSCNGPSYYVEGKLYCSSSKCAAKIVEIGEL